ncbi:hypothetical protein [Advenella kashmirensis]|uniref:hypothetical protein n=1 Tax=Advenella kashmirensis TaxID=310575 RepID=UPI00389917E3
MVEHADVLLVIGTRLGDVPTNGYTLLDLPRPHQRLIHCHPDPAELGRIYQSTIAVPIETAAVLRHWPILRRLLFARGMNGLQTGDMHLSNLPARKRAPPRQTGLI